MYILTSWRESSALLKPTNLKLLLLVSIKASLQTFGLLIKYWWWLIGTILLADVMLTGQILVEPAAMRYYVSVWWIYGYFILKFFLIFVMLLATRASIKNKNLRYFLSYIPFFVLSLSVGIVIFCIFGMCAGLIVGALGLDPVLVPYLGIRYFIMYILILWDFFLFDHGTSWFFLKDFLNALYMMVLNLPFVFISAIIFNVAIQFVFFMRYYYIKFLFPWWLQLVLQDMTFLFLILFIINIVASFYIKRVHDQCDMYCK